jgi:hypothetical protein
MSEPDDICAMAKGAVARTAIKAKAATPDRL